MLSEVDSTKEKNFVITNHETIFFFYSVTFDDFFLIYLKKV